MLIDQGKTIISEFTFLMAILQLENNGCGQKLPSSSLLENIYFFTRKDNKINNLFMNLSSQGLCQLVLTPM